MKNFKEFIKDYEDGNFTYSDKTFAYAAYCQGYAEGKEKAFKTMLSVFGGKDWQSDKATDHDFIDDKMRVYPEQLVKEYSPEELKEMQRGLKINGVMSEKDLNEYMAEHTRK